MRVRRVTVKSTAAVLFIHFFERGGQGTAVLTKICVGGYEICDFSVFVFLEEKLFFSYSGTKVSQ
jgi:hypothetical protein